MIDQKKSGTAISLQLKTDSLLYSIKNSRTNRTEIIPYENITNNQYQLFEEQPMWLAFAISFGVAALAILAATWNTQIANAGWVLLVAATAFGVLYRFSRLQLHVVATEGKHDIYFVQGNHADDAIRQIFEKRNKYLRENYGVINYEANPEEEIEKFRWLLTLGVISSREFDVIAEEIEKGY